MTTLNEARDIVAKYIIDKGWKFETADIPEKIALMHSELSEALEEYRNGNKPGELYYSTGVKPEGIDIELMDVVIRILNYYAMFGIDVENLFQVKMEYNNKRPYRHGGKLI